MSSSRVNPALLALRRSGDLFADRQSPPEAPGPQRRDSEPLTVSQLTAQLRQTLEQRFVRVAVVGELSNVRAQGSGHCYMCLKDARAQLQAVMFRREYGALKFRIEDGMQVVVRGQLTVYEARGQYQLRIDQIEPLGAGALQAAFEQTKARLAAEGLFDPAKKRPLPLVPRTVAVVTSPTGAVIRDIVHVATRRYPRARILVVPTKVQGAESAAWIARAVQRACAVAESMDVSAIVVARGGGSLEDLWGFNDEKVARAIAASPVPVVSGVGHEIDFTIADFVADVRAPTPSAAAELVFPLASDLRDGVIKPLSRMRRALRRDVARDRQRLVTAKRALGDGRLLIQAPRAAVAALLARAGAAARSQMRDERMQLQRREGRVAKAHPRTRLTATRAALVAMQTRIVVAARTDVREQRARLAELAARLHALSPLAVLDRGFALVRRDDGTVVRAASDVMPGERMDIRVARGQIRARVEIATEEDG